MLLVNPSPSPCTSKSNFWTRGDLPRSHLLWAFSSQFSPSFAFEIHFFPILFSRTHQYYSDYDSANVVTFSYPSHRPSTSKNNFISLDALNTPSLLICTSSFWCMLGPLFKSHQFSNFSIFENPDQIFQFSKLRTLRTTFNWNFSIFFPQIFVFSS